MLRRVTLVLALALAAWLAAAAYRDAASVLLFVPGWCG